VACGTPAAAPAPAREQRKTLTILFCDVAGSTALGEQLDPEALRRVMRRYFDEMSAIVERHGGTVEKFIGDAVMAVFGIPTVREDDALRAVRAAAEIRDRLPAVAAELGVALNFRTGINTGEVVVGAGQTLATGDAMNVAARLEQAAPAGEIYIGADTRRLVRDAVEVEAVEPLELKGKAEPVSAFRLVSVDFAADALARRPDAPLVGRDRELELLRGAYDRAVREGSSQLFTLLGSAGAGKSRLTAELIAGVAGEATVVRGRCLHYGDGVTFWPLVEILIQLGEPAAEVLDRISAGSAGAPAELFWDVRRLFEQIASERPLVAVFDDLQWAEPMLLDMLDHIADLSRGVPILLLCIARPELLDERQDWGGGKVNATTLLLEPLDREECETLLAGLGDGLDPATAQRIVRACGGNPLFLEEMVALVLDGGGDGDELPPTIRALLDARLERLGDGERSVIERGAVEGEVFHHRAIRALVDDPGGVDQKLAALVRKEMIRPERAQVPGDDAFRFRHLLIRDAAYDALPKQTRAELHERFAEWLEREGERLVELDEIAGWHLEQAVRYRRELGIDVDPQLASRAADHLAAGGRRAIDRRDVRAANTLLSRALGLLDPGDPRRGPLLCDLISVLVELGELERAEALLAEAPDGPRRVLARFDLLVRTNPNEMIRIADEELPALIEELRARGDDATLAKAYLALLHAHWMRSRAVLASEARAAAVDHAQRAGDATVLTEARLLGAGAAIFGPADRDAVQRWIDEAERERESPMRTARVAIARLHVAVMDGDFAEARRQLAVEVEACRSVGFELMISGAGQFAALIEMAAGDAAAAERLARESWDYGGKLGDTSLRPTTGGHLARALAALGRHDEALAIADEVDAMSADADVINFAMTRGVRAEAAAAGGDVDRAGQLAREGIEFALQTDFPIFHAFAYEALYKVDPAGSEARERMLECFRIKGYKPGIQAYS
jgi:class 3 adenylate cyclase